MAKQATGTEVEWINGIARTRIRVCGKRETFRFPTCRTPEAANERRAQLVELAARMVGVERADAVDGLQRVARAAGEQKLRVACALVDKLIGGWRPPSECATTLGAVLEMWASGELRKRYPKDVKARRNCKPAVANFKKYAGALWDMPVDAVTLDACDEIANSLGHLRAGSQRQVLAPLKRILDYCVKPLKLIDRSPLPPKWLPSAGKTRTLQWLYPSEDALLMACTAVPLWFRILCGYLVREGGREGEPIATTISRFDFEADRNTCSLPSSMIKTNNAKFWQLAPGTARALRTWFALRAARVTDLAFVNGDGDRINADYVSLPAMLREACKLAGITRPELFANTEDSRWLCIHDLRRSFVTVALALDRSERWISARTGHLSSTELHGYEERAASFAELNVGDWLPLDEAIPELAAFGQRLTSGAAKSVESFSSPDSIVELLTVPQPPVIAELHGILPVAGQPGTAISDSAGHSAAIVCEPGCIPPDVFERLVAPLAARVTAAVLVELRRELMS